MSKSSTPAANDDPWESLEEELFGIPFGKEHSAPTFDKPETSGEPATVEVSSMDEFDDDESDADDDARPAEKTQEVAPVASKKTDTSTADERGEAPSKSAQSGAPQDDFWSALEGWDWSKPAPVLSSDTNVTPDVGDDPEAADTGASTEPPRAREGRGDRGRPSRSGDRRGGRDTRGGREPRRGQGDRDRERRDEDAGATRREPSPAAAEDKPDRQGDRPERGGRRDRGSRSESPAGRGRSRGGDDRGRGTGHARSAAPAASKSDEFGDGFGDDVDDRLSSSSPPPTDDFGGIEDLVADDTTAEEQDGPASSGAEEGDDDRPRKRRRRRRGKGGRSDGPDSESGESSEADEEVVEDVDDSVAEQPRPAERAPRERGPRSRGGRGRGSRDERPRRPVAETARTTASRAPDDDDDDADEGDDLEAFGEYEGEEDAELDVDNGPPEPAEDWGLVPTWEEAISYLLHPETVQADPAQGGGGGSSSRGGRNSGGDGSPRSPSRHYGGRRPR